MSKPIVDMSSEELLSLYTFLSGYDRGGREELQVRHELGRRIDREPLVVPCKPIADMTVDELRMEHESLHEETEALNSRSREVFREWQCKYDLQETPA